MPNATVILYVSHSDLFRQPKSFCIPERSAGPFAFAQGDNTSLTAKLRVTIQRSQKSSGWHVRSFPTPVNPSHSVIPSGARKLTFAAALYCVILLRKAKQRKARIKQKRYPYGYHIISTWNEPRIFSRRKYTSAYFASALIRWNHGDSYSSEIMWYFKYIIGFL